MAVKEQTTMTLCDNGEEPTGILLVGDFQSLTDEQLRWVAAEHVHREWTYDHADALEQVIDGKVDRGWWRWVKAPEDSPHEEILEATPGPLMNGDAFLGVQVEIG